MWLHSAHNMGLNRNDITANENENCFYCVGAHSVRLFFFNLRESFFACVHLCVINQKKNLYGLMVFHWIFTVLLVQIDFIVVSMFCNIKWVMDGVRLLSMVCELCGRMATATVVAMAVKKTRIQITTVSVIISMRKLGNCIMFHRLNESKQPTHTNTHILSQALFQLGFTHPPGVSRQAESKPKWYGHYVCVEASDGCVCARVRTSHVTWDALSEIIDLKWQTKFSRLFLNWWERERESMRAQASKMCSSVFKSNGWY